MEILLARKIVSDSKLQLKISFPDMPGTVSIKEPIFIAMLQNSICSVQWVVLNRLGDVLGLDRLWLTGLQTVESVEGHSSDY